MIDNIQSEKLLDTKLDFKLTFNADIDGLLKVKLKITTYLDFNKKRLLVNVSFMSQFYCCPLIWMCHSPEAASERCSQDFYKVAIKMYKAHRGISPEILNDHFP